MGQHMNRFQLHLPTSTSSYTLYAKYFAEK